MIYKFKMLFPLFFLLCFLITGENALAVIELSVEDIVNQKDLFSESLKSKEKSVLTEPYGFYDKKMYSKCYDQALMTLNKEKNTVFEEDLISIMITCYVSIPSRKRPDFSLKHNFFEYNSTIKKVFRDLSHRLVREIIQDHKEKLNNEKLSAYLTSNLSSLCLFNEIEGFSKEAFKEVSKRNDFLNLKFKGLPCGLDLGKAYEDLEEERSIYKSYLKKGLKVLSEKPELKFRYLKRQIGKKEYSKFRKLNKAKSISYIRSLSKAPDYVINLLSRNLFFRSKYGLLYEFISLDNLPSESLSYIVKAKSSEGKYEEVLKLTDSLNYEHKKWVEESLLIRGGVFLRKKEYAKANIEFDKMAEHSKDLKLSSLYWKWISLIKNNEKREAKRVSAKLLESYPFTYYGLIVASFNEGDDFFEKYSKKYTNYSVKLKSVSKKDSQRLIEFYRLGWNKAFYNLYKELEGGFSPKEKAAFALIFNNIGDVRHAIKILNNEWDNDPVLRAEPFISTSFSFMFSDSILKEAEKNKRISSDIVRAVIRQESAFQEKAKSGSGAKGLMQLMNPTAREIARQLRVKRFNPNRNLYEAGLNIKLGSKYMDRLVYANSGYLPYAFASYNAGPGKMYKWSSKREEVHNLKKGLEYRKEDHISEFWIEELPWTETRFYTKALLRNMGIYMAISGKNKSFSCEPFWICQEEPEK